MTVQGVEETGTYFSWSTAFGPLIAIILMSMVIFLLYLSLFKRR